MMEHVCSSSEGRTGGRELTVCGSAHACGCMALGQLLEYKYYLGYVV